MWPGSLWPPSPERDGAAAVAAEALAWTAPAATASAAGTASGTITWNTPTGGSTPYSYTAAAVVYDSTGASTTAAVSTSGAGAGTTTVSGLVNGQTVVVQRTVTDALGATVSIQGAVTIAATTAAITPGTAPAGQSLAAGTTSATIGTWGSPSGGTAPYTYAVTELGGSGVTMSGSGLGPWSVAGLTDGTAYVFLLTITDSAGTPAKGYSVVTVSVASGTASGEWEVVDELDFTDANWTSLSSTDATQSTTAWQHTLYASDGVTARAYVYNNVSDARTLSLSPSGAGLTLVNGSTAVQPSVFVWPAGWGPLRAGSRRDAWMVEAIVAGEEPAGSTTFGHHFNINTSTTSVPTSPGTGLRIINSGSQIRVAASSYISGLADQAIQFLSPSPTRAYTCGVQITIADSRRHDIHVRPSATDYADPQTGQRVRVQATSTTMTSPGGDVTASSTWFATSISGRTKFGVYHDGTATTGSYVALRKLRLLRKPLGSL